jgi:hypothetical protein
MGLVGKENFYLASDSNTDDRLLRRTLRGSVRCGADENGTLEFCKSIIFSTRLVAI